MQETLLKAWSNSNSFIPGTNMRAWLVTILRNTYYSQYRKRGREVSDTDGIYSGQLATPPNQEASVDMADFQVALQKLAPEHRDVLLMVGASGLSYEETAEICGVAVGTIKSRLNRARARLADLLGIKEASDLGMGSVSEAVVRSQSRPDVTLYRRLGLDSIWSRLLGTMAVVVVPAAALIIAAGLFALCLRARRSRGVADDGGARPRRPRCRSWLDAAGRSLANEAYAARYVVAEKLPRPRRHVSSAQLRLLVRAIPRQAASPARPASRIDRQARSADPSRRAAATRLSRWSSSKARCWIASRRRAARRGPCVLVVDGAGLLRARCSRRATDRGNRRWR